MTHPSWLASAALSVIASFSFVPAANAQDFERVVPKLPPAPAPRTDVPVPDMAAATTDQTVLLPRLEGVAFVKGIDALNRAGIAAVPGGVRATGLGPIEEDEALQGRLRAMLGQPLTRAGLEQIASLVRDRYRAKGRPFIDVSVPPQNIESGVIQVVVTEFRVGEIAVEGNRHFSTRLIRSMGDLRSGETLTVPRLRKALDDYNQNPFLTVSAVARPGGKTGLSDVVLQAEDRLPVRVYGGYDNQGSPSLDRNEWYVGFNLGNVLGTGQTLSYQFTQSFNHAYTSHSVSDLIPLGPDDRLVVFGAHAVQKPPISPYFTSVGHATQASLRYAHDLAGGVNERHIVQLGFDYKRTDNNLDFFGFRLLDTAVEVAQFPLIYTGTFNDTAGQTVLENQLVVSPGGLTSHNHDASLQLLVPFAKASYVFDRVSITRTTKLPAGASSILRVMTQFASSNLPYSEQLGGGGIGSVRGYDTNTALGSRGILVSNELRTPAFNLLGRAAGRQGDMLQLGVFIDYANLTPVKRIPDLPYRTQLLGTGMSAHYAVGRLIDLEADLGWQLRQAPGVSRRGIRAAVTATIAFPR